MSEKPYCSICGVPYDGFGNNAWPVNPGRCCDVCNQLVIMRRIRNVTEGRPAYGYPDWWEEAMSHVEHSPQKDSLAKEPESE